MRYDRMYGVLGTVGAIAYGSIGASEDDLFRAITVSGEEIVGDDYLVGDDEIVGDDGYLIGARRPQRPQRSGTRVVQSRPTRKRRLVTGVPATAIGAALTADVSTQPQETFRIERVTVPSNIAFFFSFQDIKIGQRSQLVAAGVLPCGAFTEVAVDSYVEFDTANVGNLVTFSVTNNDAATQTFRAMVLGTAAV